MNFTLTDVFAADCAFYTTFASQVPMKRVDGLIKGTGIRGPLAKK